MGQAVTERDYPVTGRWLLKTTLPHILIIFVLMIGVPIFFRLADTAGGGRGAPAPPPDALVVSFTAFVVVIGLSPFLLGVFIPVLRRFTFHYTLEDDVLVVRQGILAKQQRYIPYHAIQDVLIERDIYDRFLGLASLTLENASLFGGVEPTPRSSVIVGGFRVRDFIQGGRIGTFGSGVFIPGLAKEHAQALRQIILQKVKEHPETSRSGL